jgi:hypothetical protein
MSAEKRQTRISFLMDLSSEAENRTCTPLKTIELWMDFAVYRKVDGPQTIQHGLDRMPFLAVACSRYGKES